MLLCYSLLLQAVDLTGDISWSPTKMVSHKKMLSARQSCTQLLYCLCSSNSEIHEHEVCNMGPNSNAQVSFNNRSRPQRLDESATRRSKSTLNNL